MKLVAMMLVKNEENRYLREVLRDLLKYVDEIVVLNDGSTDNTLTICNSFKRVFTQTLGISIWKQNEKLLRETLYEMVIERNVDWVLAIDSDEIFEDRFKQEIREMMKQSLDWYSFNWYNFWTPDSYHRISPSSMKSLRRLFRYLPNELPNFISAYHHCGSVPNWVYWNSNGKETDIRVKHLGFIRKEDRLARIKINEDTSNWYSFKWEYAKELKKLEQLYENGKLKLTKWKE